MLSEIEADYKRQGGAIDLAIYLQEHRSILEAVNWLGIVDENGDLIHSSTPPASSTFNFTASEAFHTLKDTATPLLFIDKPRRGAATGELSIFLGRRIGKPDGSFGGIATLALSPEAFSRLYSAQELGEDFSIMLIGRDGVVRAHQTTEGLTVDPRADERVFFDELAPGANQGSFVSARLADRIPRIYAYQPVPDYPLVVVVGTSLAAALAPYNAAQFLQFPVAIGLTGAILVLGLFALFQLRRKDRATRQLLLAQHALASSPSAIAISNRDGFLDYANPAFAKLWNLGTAGEAIGRNAATFFADPAEARAVLARLPEEGNWTGTARAKVSDAEVKTLNFDAFVVRDPRGRPLAMMFAFLDLTAQQTTERELADERLLSLSIIETAPAIILLLSPEGRIQRVNRFFEELTGYSRKEILGRDWSTSFLPEREHARIRALLARAIEVEPTRGNVNPIVTRSGEERPIEWSDRVIRDSRGMVVSLLAIGIDITERLAAEEARERERQQLRSILDSMYAFIGIFNLDGLVIDANRAPLEAAGLTRADVIGKPFWDTYWWSYSSAMQDRLRRVLGRAAQGETVREDFVVRVAENAFITIDAVFGPIRLTDGSAGIVGSGVDITDRLSTAQSLRESEALIRGFLDHAPLFVGVKGVDGKWLRANNKYLELSGLTEAQVIGKRSSEFSPLVAAEAGEALDRDVIATVAPVQRIVPFQTASGLREFLETKFPIFDQEGRVTQIGIVGNDISDMLEADRVLSRTTARLKEAQHIGRIGSWELDLLSGSLLWSDQIFSIFEIDPERFSASYEAFLTSIHPDDRDAVNKAYSESVANHAPYQIVHRLRMPDGRIKWVEERCQTSYGENGQPVRSVGTVQDVTERILAEQQIQLSLTEKETLLREIHHRVKNNLQMISSLLYFQAQKLKNPADLEVLMDGRDRVRAMMLVHETLYQSQSLSRVDFSHYVRRLVHQLLDAHKPGRGRITTRFDLCDTALSIEQAMPAGLLICELVVNAMKHGFPGDRAGEIFVSVVDADGSLQVTVGDDGVGLPDGFDREATGAFGWQLIKSLIIQLNATIDVTSGPGTVVTISFPHTHGDIVQ